jgi:hypothetical protein
MSGDEGVYVPFRSVVRDATERIERPTRSLTLASVGIALLPLFALGIDVAIFSGGSESISWSTLGVVAVIAQLVACLLAGLDQQRLLALRLVQPTSPLIALFCPIAYLFVRGSRAHSETYTGFGPAWLGVAAILGAVIAILTLPLSLSTLNVLTSIPRG